MSTEVAVTAQFFATLAEALGHLCIFDNIRDPVQNSLVVRVGGVCCTLAFAEHFLNSKKKSVLLTASFLQRKQRQFSSKKAFFQKSGKEKTKNLKARKNASGYLNNN